jgi:hypothetical protein
MLTLPAQYSQLLPRNQQTNILRIECKGDNIYYFNPWTYDGTLQRNRVRNFVAH